MNALTATTEDILIEVSRIMREEQAKIDVRLQALNQGDDFVGLERYRP